MKFTRFNLFFVIVFLFTTISYAQTIKVACIGDSVTYGYGIENIEENSYPVQLQQLLGATYKVANFGYSGATMLKNGHKPYWDKEVYKKSQEFDPTIVIIHLGLNDQGNNNWPQHKDEFESDYLDMIATYKNLPSKPTVIICRMTPTFSGHHWFEEGMRENFKEIQTKIEEIGKKAGVEVIDLHEPLYRFPEYFPDNLHPTKEGAKVIAKKVYCAISGNYGGLKVPLLYGENMVLQRNKPINFEGTANYNDKITVEFNNKTKTTTTDFNGNWKIAYEPMQAGGPFPLKIASDKTAVDISTVYIGEVWLASGQSNMDFKVRDMKNASTVLKDSLNLNVFVFSMDPQVLGANKFSKEEHALCNAEDYYTYSGWTNSNNEIFENFSAVAYAYAYNLQKELKIPVGIICNAVGGSPAQSWISRERMEKTHETISLLNDVWEHPLVDSWVSQRRTDNFGGSKQLKERHPYDPTFLFDSGILPLTNYNIKGVIWYQGESNTENPDLHSKLFTMLINDWRHHFKNPELPFYFVQLSSLDRPNWGSFRDSQRKLLSVKHTGMAVSSDVGNLTNVHPKKKWIVGNRLTKIALAKSYDKTVPYSGPLFDFVNVIDNTLEAHFKYAESLKTFDGTSVRDIQIAGADKVFVNAESKIEDDILFVWSKQIVNPRYIKYGYSSFTNGNLVNSNNLPASTFSNIKN